MLREALARNNYLSALGRTKGSMVSVNLVANTDLRTPEEFRQLVVKEEDGVVVRLGEIADVVLGAENYEEDVRFNGQTAMFMGVWVLPTANSLDVIRRVREEIPDHPGPGAGGMKVGIPYDSTEYIEDAINEVLTTLTETLFIVIVVIFLFLGSVRAVIIPVVAIPISLVGAVFLMLVAGFTINLLTLLAIVLSVGLVVDDAIVMVENIERHIHGGKPAVPGGHRRRPGAGRPDHRDDDHAGCGVCPGRHPGRADGRAVPRVRVHAGRSRDRVRRGRADAVADDGGEAPALRADSERGFAGWINRRFDGVRSAYTRTLTSTLRYSPVVLVLWVIVARADGAVLHVLAARARAHRRSGRRVLDSPDVRELHDRSDEALRRAGRRRLSSVSRDRQHLSAHVSDRRLRRHGDQTVERADQDDRAAPDGDRWGRCRRSRASARSR